MPILLNFVGPKHPSGSCYISCFLTDRTALLLFNDSTNFFNKFFCEEEFSIEIKIYKNAFFVYFDFNLFETIIINKLIFCFWHVISQLGIVKFDKISKLEISAVFALCWLSQFCTLQKKLGIGYLNIRKFVNSTQTK